jgi:hypothetical protein
MNQINSTTAHSIESHFNGKDPVVRKVYDAILKVAKAWGPVSEEAKKTSIHLVRKSAFAGVATRKAYLILTVKSKTELESERIFRREQASSSRWHSEIKVESPAAVDGELKTWLRNSFDISG